MELLDWPKEKEATKNKSNPTRELDPTPQVESIGFLGLGQPESASVGPSITTDVPLHTDRCRRGGYGPI